LSAAVTSETSTNKPQFTTHRQQQHRRSFVNSDGRRPISVVAHSTACATEYRQRQQQHTIILPITREARGTSPGANDSSGGDDDISVTELAAYIEHELVLPRPMSEQVDSMYA
jgi:hypothetical protein